MDVDEDKATWEDFVTKYNMDWIRCWGCRAVDHHSFGLAPRDRIMVPRYLLLDSDGAILRSFTGMDSISKVAEEIRRIVRSAADQSETDGQPPANVIAPSPRPE